MIVQDYHIKDGQSDYHLFSPELTAPGFSYGYLFTDKPDFSTPVEMTRGKNCPK